MKTRILLPVFLMIAFLTSCDLYEDIFDCKKEETSFVADVSAETEYDFLAFAEKDGSFLAVKENNGLPVEAIFRPSSDDEAYPIWFDCNGYPEKMVVMNYVFLFSNYTKTSFDFAIISPDGTVNVAREVPIPQEYHEFMRLKSVSKADALRWAGHIIGAVSCGMAVFGGGAATLASAGIAAPAAVAIVALGCGATAVGIAAEFVGDDKIADALGISSKGVKSFTTSMNCIFGKISSCLLGATGLALGTAGTIMEENEEAVDLAQGALHGGYGDIQVTLAWDSPADIDLYVKDPSGEMIWYSHKTSASGGWLDVDDTNGYGPENIFWDKNEAPSGTYNVYVKHYDGGSANYTVLVQAFGRTKQYKGSINPRQSVTITDFSKNHLKNAEIISAEIVLPSSPK